MYKGAVFEKGKATEVTEEWFEKHQNPKLRVEGNSFDVSKAKKAELVEYAEANGIDIDGLKVAEMRQAIKEAQ